MRQILIREWETLPIGPGGITADEADALHRAAHSAANRLKLQHFAVLERGYNCLRARQVCGVLIAGGVHLEILPKLEDSSGNLRKTLVRMLACAYDLPIAEGQMAALGVQDHSLLDTFMHLFLTRLSEQTKQGLMRHYVATEDVLPLLRGRLDLRQQLHRRPGNPSKIHCRFEELSEDTPLNQVFKACLNQLRLVVRSNRSRRLLDQLATRFATIPASTSPLKTSIHWNRMNNRFRPAYDLAIILLNALSQSTTTGNSSGIALLFAMNDLFERYIGRTLQRALPAGSVSLQDKTHHLLTGKKFVLKPDIVITSNNGPIILDTKWKDLDWDSNQPNIKSSDLYQLAAYAAAYKSQRVILIYPADRPAPAPTTWSYDATSVEVIICQVNLVDVDPIGGLASCLGAP